MKIGENTFDLQNQSVVLPGEERIHACPFRTELLKTCNEEVKTVLDILEYSYEKFAENEFLGCRESDTSPYTWITYKETKEMACAVGSGLITLGIKPKSLIGFCAKNQPKWTIADHAINRHSMLAVPLYETLGKEGIHHIMGQTEIEVIFCDANKIEKLIEHGGSLGFLKWMILLNEPNEAAIAKAKENGIKLIPFEDLIESGRKNPQPDTSPLPEDITCICYTSGTTGNPKGVLLSHGGMVAACSATLSIAEIDFEVLESDSLISYLPLSHSYGRAAELTMAFAGGKIGYFRGDVSKLLSDIQELKPTIFPTVPRLLNSLYDRVMLSVANSKLKSYLLRRAIAAKSELLKKGKYTKSTIWDKLIFGKIQKNLGGRVRVCNSGSAPLSPAVLLFTKCALGCVVIEGYGQTECSGPISASCVYDIEPGHVGMLIPCLHAKVVDVPELGYSANDDCGEICLRGPSLFSGYYKDPERTKEALDEDGWLHTGDIGQWLPSGTLKIIDRKKHIFKLSQGEYVAPEKVEIVYIKSIYVTQVFVTGDSLKNFVVAIVVPDQDALMQWAKKNNIKASLEELCKREDVNVMVLDSMNQKAKEEKLCSFEQAKIIYIDPEPFSIDNNLLTPTMKNKRPQIKKKYQDIVEELYGKQESLQPPRITVF